MIVETYPSRRGITLTYLLFVDDLFLLIEASYNQVIILNVSCQFWMIFAVAQERRLIKLKLNSISLRMSTLHLLIILALCLDFLLLRILVNILECPYFILRYPRMPLLHSRVSKNTYQSILDKVDQRLFGWNATHLSLVVHITLGQSIIQAFPIYVMQTTKLPSLTKSKVDQYCKRFIWSETNSQRKISLVSDDKVMLLTLSRCYTLTVKTH